jgi:hypothetical protein
MIAKNLYGRAWQTAARQHRIANPYCAWCGEQVWLGDSERQPPIDHIVPHHGDMRLFWDQSNWQTLCEDCHGQKTRSEAITGVIDWKPRSDRGVVWGKAGTGKSTWARQHVCGDYIWDMDEVAAALGYCKYPRTRRQQEVLLAERTRWVRAVIDWDAPGCLLVESGRTARHFGRLLQARLVPMWCPEEERQRRLRERWESVS